ncbi:BrnT family toxin, partial [Thiospirillum jenense]
MKFDWDSKKAAANIRKHGVSCEEAGTVFGDPMALTFNDPDHSTGEMHFLTFGITRTNQCVIVSYTEWQGITESLALAKCVSKKEIFMKTTKSSSDDMRSKYKRDDLGVGVRGKHYR